MDQALFVIRVYRIPYLWAALQRASIGGCHAGPRQTPRQGPFKCYVKIYKVHVRETYDFHSVVVSNVSGRFCGFWAAQEGAMEYCEEL